MNKTNGTLQGYQVYIDNCEKCKLRIELVWTFEEYKKFYNKS